MAKKRGRPTSPTEGAFEAVRQIKKLKKNKSLSDSDLGRIIGVNQSSVYRALNNETFSWTPTMRKLWEYAKKEIGEKNKKQIISKAVYMSENQKQTLLEAVISAWDGSAEGLERLLRLLKIVHELSEQG